MQSSHLIMFATGATLVAIVAGLGMMQALQPARTQNTTAEQTGAMTQAWAAAQVADRLPEFSLPDLSGATRDIAEWRGDVIVLNVWATWCAPCREEVPMLIEAQDRFAAQGLTVIGLTLDHPAPAQRFADNFGINYPLLIDDSDQRAVMAQLGSQSLGLPHTFIVDRDGSIVGFHLGLMSAQELVDQVTPLLNPPG